MRTFPLSFSHWLFHWHSFERRRQTAFINYLICSITNTKVYSNDKNLPKKKKKYFKNEKWKKIHTIFPLYKLFDIHSYSMSHVSLLAWHAIKQLVCQTIFCNLFAWNCLFLDHIYYLYEYFQYEKFIAIGQLWDSSHFLMTMNWVRVWEVVPMSEKAVCDFEIVLRGRAATVR